MLSTLAHQGGSGAHAGLWAHWSTDPLVLVGLVALACAYHRGSHRRPRLDRARARAFWGGLLCVALALMSPLDALAGDLASAHMVQHLLLVVVAAPLLAQGAPVAAVVGAWPRAARTQLRRARRIARSTPLLHDLRRPGVAWLLHAAALWFWHASGPYGAALENHAAHAAQHASFLLTAVLFWSSILRARGPWRMSEGYGALLVFTMAMQNVFLALLLTFATSPWYSGYRDSAAAWGLDQLADQQLAGVIMWVPAGFVYVAAGILLVTRWIRGSGGALLGMDADWVDSDDSRANWPARAPATTRSGTPP